MVDESQTMSLPFNQSVEQAENWGCGQWLYLNDRFNLVPCVFGEDITYQCDHLVISLCCRDRVYTKYSVVQIEEKYGLPLRFKSDPTRCIQGIKNGANNSYKSSVNREGIVESTKRGKAGRQGEEKEKFPTPTKPVQSPAAPHPSSQTSPFPSLTSLKRGGNEVRILAFLLS